MKTMEVTEEVFSQLDRKSRREPRTAPAHPHFRIKQGLGLRKTGASLVRRENHEKMSTSIAGKQPNVKYHFKPFCLRLLFGPRPKWTLVRVLILIITSLVLFNWILVPVRVVGRSMEPTCYDGQIAVINSLSFIRHQPGRGDIVGFRLTNNPQIIIKRIVGLPGEHIAFHSGVVFINGKSIAEPYLTSQGAWEWPEETLAENTYFVTGDNRVISQQFRVERSRILGKLYSWHP
jgi:signal peptidase I